MRRSVAGAAAFLALLALPAAATAATAQGGLAVPAVNISVGPAGSPGQVTSSLQILLFLTVLSLAPAVLLLMTSFTRIVVVLSFARTALGSASLPPNQVLIGLALFLTLFVMAPTIGQIYASAYRPYQQGTITLAAALQQAEVPLKSFMERQTAPADLTLFENMQKGRPGASLAPPVPATPAAAGPSLVVLIPAFVVSELRVAFEMGFLLYVPFVIIDLVVASTLMAMGMIMLPPTLISLPFKILLFVLVDGWSLLAQSLVTSFH
jgi:flagellar biosynthetic protein FliP